MKQCARTVGKFLHEHWCHYCIIKLLIIAVSIATFVYDITLIINYFNKHSDYHIHQGHYLLRTPEQQFRSFHVDACCQYFSSLNQYDLDAINGNDLLLVVLSLIFAFFGIVVFSIWALFLKVKGKFGSYATMTIASLLLSQFSLMRTVVKFGDLCVQCSHLQILLVSPQFYPFIGLFIFVIGIVAVVIYFKVDFEENKILFYCWLFLLFLMTVLLGVCIVLTIMNSPFGVLILIGIILNLLCLTEAYYEYDEKKTQYDREEGCCQSIRNMCDFTSPV